jgi:hypothetical protein
MLVAEAIEGNRSYCSKMSLGSELLRLDPRDDLLGFFPQCVEFRTGTDGEPPDRSKNSPSFWLDLVVLAGGGGGGSC